jgi:hypothetical protein
MSDNPKTINEEAGLPENWVPVDRPPLNPNALGSDALIDGNLKYLQGSLPPSFQHDSSFVNTTYKSPNSHSAGLVPLGINGNPSTNAAIESTSRLAVSVGSTGTTTDDDSTVDGLIHGQLPWESDPAYVLMRDDFMTYSPWATTASAQSNTWGDLGWGIFPSSLQVDQLGNHGGAPGHIGQVGWQNNGTANGFGALAISTTPVYTSTPGLLPFSMALLENPGWRLSWVFKFGAPYRVSSAAFGTTKKSFYIGLCGPVSAATNFSGGGSPRPNTFIGLRYDTSTTPGTITLSAAANASGGNTSYTISPAIPSSQANAYVGMTFVVSGFTTGANNGTFTCVSNTTAALVLNNPSGVAETHAGSAAGPVGLNDTYFTFESVANRIWTGGGNRTNTQGTTQVTTVQPKPGVWHRLDMVCTVAGQIVCTLDGSSTNTVTFTVPQISYGFTGIYTGQVSAAGGIGRVATNVHSFTTGITASTPEVGEGSSVTVSGLSAGNAGLNGTQVLDVYSYNVSSMMFPTTSSPIGNNSAAFTLSAYPALTPFVSYGNDDTASPTADSMRLYVDFFSYIANPGIIGLTSATADPTKSRYFS